MGFVFQSRCKLCLLINQDADLWWNIHKKILENGASVRSVAIWLEEEVPRRNMERPPDDQLPKFSYENLHGHFSKKKHVPSMQAAREACADGWKADLEKLGGKDVVTAPSLCQSLPVVSEEVHDLIRMKQLVYATERRLHAYNNALTKKEKLTSEAVSSLEEIATFQKLIKELLTLKKEATKVETGVEVAGAALREALSILVDETMKTLASSTDELYAMLTRELPGSKLPEQVRSTVRMQVGEKMKTAVPAILDAVQKRYSIK